MSSKQVVAVGKRWSFQDGRGVGRYFPSVDKLSWQGIAVILSTVFFVSLLISLPQFLGMIETGEDEASVVGVDEGRGDRDNHPPLFGGDESGEGDSSSQTPLGYATRHPTTTAVEPSTPALPPTARVGVVIAGRHKFPTDLVRRFCSISASEISSSIVPVQVLVAMFSVTKGDSELTEARLHFEETCLTKIRGGKEQSAARKSFSMAFVDEHESMSSLSQMYNTALYGAQKDVTHFVFLDGSVTPMESAAHFLNGLIATMLVAVAEPQTLPLGHGEQSSPFPQLAGCCLVDPDRDITVAKGYEISFEVSDDEASLTVHRQLPLLTRRYYGFPMYDDRNYEVDEVGLVGPHCLAATRHIIRRLNGFRWKFPTREDAVRRGELTPESFADTLVEHYAVYWLCADSVRSLSIRDVQMASGPERALVRTVSAGSMRLQAHFKTRFAALNNSEWQELALHKFEELKKVRDSSSTNMFSRIEHVGEELQRYEARVDGVLNELASEEELGVDLSLSAISALFGDGVEVDVESHAVKSPLFSKFIVSTNATAAISANRHGHVLTMAAAPPDMTPRGRLSSLSKDLLSTVLRRRSSFAISPVLLRQHGAFIDAVYASRGAMVFRRPLPKDNRAMMNRTQIVAALQAQQDQGNPEDELLSVSRLRVYWEMWCCRCCGFTSELTSYLINLRRFIHTEVSIPPLCFCDSNIAYVSDQIDFAHGSNMLPLVDTDVLVLIHHRAPNSIHSVTVAQEMMSSKPDYKIVRCMYEFSRIPADWVNISNDDGRVDELWVPGKSVRQAFVDSGVREDKITVLPEAVDVHFFDPAVHRPFLVDHLEHIFADGLHCNKAASRILSPRPRSSRPYVFFSQFKWEPRKGWDVLLQSWAHAFSSSKSSAEGSGEPSPDVLLLMLVNLFIVDGVNATDRFNYTYMHNDAERMLHDTLDMTLDDLPPLCFLTTEVSEDHLARLFRTADAFVLPTRGEGWCLPAMQAMSMGLPSLVTGYGGQLEFMVHNDNSLLIDFKLMPTPKTFYYQHADGMEWAEPSPMDLARLMQFVFSHPRAGSTIGRRAREHIVTHFSEEAVGLVLRQKLTSIQQKLGPRRLSWKNRRREKDKVKEKAKPGILEEKESPSP